MTISASAPSARAARAGVALPDVLAHQQRHARALDVDQRRRLARREVALLVEHLVVRQRLLAVVGVDAAAAHQRRGVEDLAALVLRVAEHQVDRRRVAAQPLDGRLHLAPEAGVEQQVLGRIAGERELGQQHEVDAGLGPGPRRRQHARGVAVDIADEQVVLREQQAKPGGAHGFWTVLHLPARPAAGPRVSCQRRLPRAVGRRAALAGARAARRFAAGGAGRRAALARRCFRGRLGPRPRAARGLERRGHRRAELGRRAHRRDAGMLEGRVLVRRGALAAGDHRAGVAHALAGRRRDAGDVGDHRLADVAVDELGRRLLVAAADLADHDDALRLRVVLEQAQHVDEVHAAHRVAADADAGALAEAEARGLEHRLVGQRAGARHDADPAGLVDEARHDADLGLARRDYARAVRADEARVVALEGLADTDHVVDRDALGDADDQLDAGVGGLEDRVGRAGRRHVDHADVGAGLAHRVVRGVEHRQAEVLLAAAAGRDAADQLRAVGDALLGVERALLAGEALADHAALLGEEDAHEASVPSGPRRGARPWSPHRSDRSPR